MAGGTMYFQRRLLGAIDLYKRKRISHIIFMRNDAPLFDYHSIDPYWTQTNWAVEILKLYDIPGEDITILEPAESDFLGTLREAQLYKQAIAKKFSQLVVVTSAAHTRRSYLAFRRTLDDNIKITPYAVTPFNISTERFRPIWLEYVKLVVYFIVA
jgi:uncharacterized SAM-binding protein YcdF (DUF218 family)